MYQEHLAKTLTDKYNSLDKHLDDTIVRANTEITTLVEKLKSLHSYHKKLEARLQFIGVELENETISRKNYELSETLREKAKRLLQTQVRKLDRLNKV